MLGAVGPIFIVLFLFRQTRGFFAGWVRAMAAAALVSAGTWTLILLMLRVLEPWLVTLAQQRELKALDPRTAMTAASIVEVFTAAQIGMVLLAAGVAFAFRLGSTPRVIASAPERGPERWAVRWRARARAGRADLARRPPGRPAAPLRSPPRGPRARRRGARRLGPLDRGPAGPAAPCFRPTAPIAAPPPRAAGA